MGHTVVDLIAFRVVFKSSYSHFVVCVTPVLVPENIFLCLASSLIILRGILVVSSDTYTFIVPLLVGHSLFSPWSFVCES